MRGRNIISQMLLESLSRWDDICSRAHTRLVSEKSHETETFSLVSLLIELKTNADLLLLLLLLLLPPLLSLYPSAHACIYARAQWKEMLLLFEL